MLVDFCAGALQSSGRPKWKSSSSDYGESEAEKKNKHNTEMCHLAARNTPTKKNTSFCHGFAWAVLSSGPNRALIGTLFDSFFIWVHWRAMPDWGPYSGPLFAPILGLVDVEGWSCSSHKCLIGLVVPGGQVHE